MRPLHLAPAVLVAFFPLLAVINQPSAAPTAASPLGRLLHSVYWRR